ncbi:SPFH domain-containing protein [Pedobacter nototheniae]|uniref:SPFH domain-containing protein n=1 Tax=Pedobacter nototheniae TaxID=2488994 RepID=UPI00103C71F1|nr:MULTISPECIES: SPFH domain-containing protein [Pedobacter]
MGLKEYFKRQLSQVIEWNDQQTDLLVYKFPSENDEIKNAGKLIVSPGQGAILVYEGTVTDHITTPGIYNLETDNHPFITTLLKLRTNFESEHKLKIYFFRTSENVNQGWGTSQAIKYVDPVYHFPVELGANGSFSFKISNALHLFTQVVGSKDVYSVQEARQLLQSRFPQTLASVLATAGISYQQIDTQLATLSESLKVQLNVELDKLGFELTDFKLNGTVFDESTKERINKIANITADAMAADQGGLTYVELEKLKALRDAARNEGGLAGAGLQFGAGMELGKAFNVEKDLQLNNNNVDPVAKLQQLKLLLTEGIITQEEFDGKKKEWLDKL